MTSRRSTSRYTFLLADAQRTLRSRKQTIVTASSSEAEYVATFFAAQEAASLGRLFVSLHPHPIQTHVVLYMDCDELIDLTACSTMQQRIEHVYINYHFSRDLVHTGVVNVENCPTAHMKADPLFCHLPRSSRQIPSPAPCVFLNSLQAFFCARTSSSSWRPMYTGRLCRSAYSIPLH